MPFYTKELRMVSPESIDLCFMGRRIIHLDLDAFFCAVEELHHPELRGKPFAVGGKPNERGVVASCSYPARALGIRSAMPMSRAIRLCPHLTIIPSNHVTYQEYSEKVMEIIHRFSSSVEKTSIDEAFIDISEQGDSALEIAQKLQEIINEELHLPCSLGIASNKLVAKIANDFGKASVTGGSPPNTITDVAPGNEAAFLSPLPVRYLWGVGPKTTDRLHSLNIRTIGELAAVPIETLVQHFGKNGLLLAMHAKGEDNSPICIEHELKSISQETTFSRNIGDIINLKEALRQQSKQVCQRLQAEKLLCRTIKIKLRWPDFRTITRQKTIERLTDNEELIYETAQELLLSVWHAGQSIRLIGVGVSGLAAKPSHAARQLTFWEETLH